VSDQDNKPWEWGDKGVPQNPINHYPEGTRFLCCGYDGHMNQFSQGNWVRHEDYAKLQMERIHDLNQMGGLCEENARLKAEVERLQSIHSIDSIGIEQLKAEVERLSKKEDYQHDLLNQYAEDEARLKSDLQMEKENEDRLVREWQRANNEVYGLQRQVAALIDDQTRLKAEVERLRFAEDLLKDENQHLHKEQPLPDGWNSAVAKACDLLAEKEKEIARLKAEVERLTSDIQMEKENEDRLVREWQRANNEVYGLQSQVAALIDDQTRLKAEVERLQKAIMDSVEMRQRLREIENGGQP